MKNLINPVQRIEKTPLGVALEISSRNGGKYTPNKTELENGYFFIVEGVAVPFRAVLNENGKTEGIAGIGFGTARDCPSRSLGLCQLPEDKFCYALSGEKRATKRENSEGLRGMDSYLNGLLCSEFWNQYKLNPKLRVKFSEYLEYKGIDTIRFNLKGDFRDADDICIIWHLAESEGLSLTGYTARDDLSDLLETIAEHPRIILNGSNRMYTNRFRVTTSLEDYLDAPYRCVGNCSGCRNCYSLRGVEIVVLVHGSGSDTLLNTVGNQKYLINRFYYDMGLEFDEDKFEESKGLLTAINKDFKSFAVDFEGFRNIKEFLNFLESPRFLIYNEFSGSYYIADNFQAERGLFSGNSKEETFELFAMSWGDPRAIIEVRGDL